MRFFRRRRRPSRVDVGKFSAPPIRPLPPLDQVVEEGLLLTMWSVRMVVKNRLIIAALREGSDYDPGGLIEAARQETLALAEENDATATRLREHDKQSRIRPPTPLGTGEVPATTARREAEEHRRRPIVHERLAALLRDRSEDDEALRQIVEQARSDAWDEVGREIVLGIKPPGFVPENLRDYERMREGRLQRLVTIDLAELARESQERAETAKSPGEEPSAV